MSKLWGYPFPNLKDPYVYLSSLLTDPYSPSKHIANGASYLLEVNAYSPDSALKQRRENAFAFLIQVADKQKAHELAFIQQRIEDLRKLKLDEGTEVQELYDALEAMKANDNIDYIQFIKGLNSVINSLEKYKTRIQAFNKTAISNIPQVNAVKELATTIGSITGQRRSIYYSQEEVIRQIAFKYLQKYGKDFIQSQLSLGQNGATNIVAVLALLTQQLAQYIYDNRLLVEKHTKKGKYRDFPTKEAFYKKIKELTETIDGKPSALDNFEKTYNFSSALQNDKLLDEVKTLYGLNYDKYVTGNGRVLSISGRKEAFEIQAALKSDPLLGNESMRDYMKHITITWTDNRKLALEDELVSAINPAFGAHRHTGRLEMGTDMLLGYAGIGVEFQDDNNAISNTLDTIVNRLQNESATNKVHESSKIYLEELMNLNATLKNLRKSFIIHETNKDYNTLEKGKWPNGMNSFEGRNMNLMNYINAIHSMGAIEGIDTSWFMFASYNLATDALGSILKNPLEHIFAIFGGMIMFDDFAIIGKEINENMSFSSLENIHLYKLQDIYVPASTFLYATYNAFSKLGQELFEGNGFTAELIVPTIDYYGLEKNKKNNKSKYEGSFPERWEKVRETAEKSTKIHLHFAANFFNLMSKLL